MSKFKQTFQHFFVVRELVSREIKRKYTRSYLGIIWSVLNPLLSMAIISAIFSTIFKRSIENFPVYYLTGHLIWQMFTEATNAAMTSLVDNKMLLIRVKFPMKVFPLARAVSALVNFFYSFAAYVVILIALDIPFNITMLFFPAIILLLFVFSMGVSYILTVAYVYFGDIQHLYSVFLTLLMYCSAIFYPAEYVTGGMAAVVRWNPLYSFIKCARDCMMYGKLPEQFYLTQMLIWSLAIYALGISIFNDNKYKIMKKV